MFSLASVLYAMKEDSEKVPVLLTDYILKGNYWTAVLISYLLMSVTLYLHISKHCL